MKKSLFPARRRLIAAIIVTVALPIFAFTALVISLDGGMKGPALFMLTPLFAASAFVLALSAWRAFPSSRRARAAILAIGLLTLPSGILATGFMVSHGVAFPIRALVPGKAAAPFQHTRIIFRSHGNDFVISDPFNRLQFRYGAPPASVGIRNGLRTVIFDQPVHLKSWSDCIAMEENEVMRSDWMDLGTSAHEGSIIVTPDGRISEAGGP